MSPRRARVAALPILAGLAALPALATVYRLPEETPIALPPGPDVELVESRCAACHSLDYVRTQPRGKGTQFWRDSVAKMINVYGAPLDPEEAAKISAYLARTYGCPLERFTMTGRAQAIRRAIAPPRKPHRPPAVPR